MVDAQATGPLATLSQAFRDYQAILADAGVVIRPCDKTIIHDGIDGDVSVRDFSDSLKNNSRPSVRDGASHTAHAFVAWLRTTYNLQ
jgi:hypothetical protein